jgi:hypothetical protein
LEQTSNFDASIYRTQPKDFVLEKDKHFGFSWIPSLENWPLFDLKSNLGKAEKLYPT